MAPKAKATRSSKKAKVVEEVERVEFEIAPLTGILIRLVSLLIKFSLVELE